MTAAATPGRPAPAPDVPRSRVRTVLRAIVRPPVTGWSSVAFLLLMLLVAGLAVDQPRLAGMGPRGSQTGFLPAVMVIAGVLGVLMARLRLPVGPAHVLASLIGVGVLLIAWGLAIAPDPTIAERFRAVNEAAARLFQAVVVERGRTDQTIGFLIVVGSIAWTTGYFSAYNLVRRALVAPAIVSIGTLVLVISLSPTVGVGALYLHLVLLTGLALLLVLRANLAHQQAGWRRRHIMGGHAVEQLFLRGGAIVCVVAIGGASLLAANVVSAPLADTWTRLDQRLLEVAERIDALFGGIASGDDPPGGSFGDSARIADTWASGDAIVFVAVPDDGQPHYWQGAAFSRFDGSSWRRDRALAAVSPVRAFGGLLDGSADAAIEDATGTRDVTVTVTSQGLDGTTMLAPAVALSVDRETRVTLDGAGGPLGEIEFRESLPLGDAYTVISRVPEPGEDGLTQSRLAAAGRVYPEWARRYTEIAPGTLSDQAAGLAERLEEALPEDRRDPFHVAQLMEAWFAGTGRFRDDSMRFAYATDIRGDCRPTEGVVDCLLRIRQGFCQHYATAMTMMLRSRSIPARYVQGYLPGQRMADGSWSVPVAAAHAWVEVYFPGEGWVRFDPTPGGNAENGQTTMDLPVGEPVPTPTPLDPTAPQPTPVFSDAPEPSPLPTTSPPPPDEEEAAGMLGLDLPWPTVLLALLLLVLIVTIALLIRRFRREPAREPDLLYRALVLLATRVGYGPRPEQTAYEYTAGLARAVPSVTQDLHAVARAKVESTYGRHDHAVDALDGLVASYRRARRALLGLVLRRPRRR